jgi:RNA polymerase sigma-70 factor, ECF subfamily
MTLLPEYSSRPESRETEKICLRLASPPQITERGGLWITARCVIQRPLPCVQADVNAHEAKSCTGPRRFPLNRGALLSPVEVAAPLDAQAQARLIGLVAAQDRQAFAQLFKHFAPRLKAFHLRAGLTDAAAEELTQETMILLWRKAASFDPARAAAATWVFTITRNLRIGLTRRQRGTPPELEPEENLTPSAEAQYLSAECVMRMHSSLAALPPEQRQAVELSFFADTPHATIASALKLPLGTVKSRIRLALARLRDALGTEP